MNSTKVNVLVKVRYFMMENLIDFNCLSISSDCVGIILQVQYGLDANDIWSQVVQKYGEFISWGEICTVDTLKDKTDVFIKLLDDAGFSNKEIYELDNMNKLFIKNEQYTNAHYINYLNNILQGVNF
jgi:hypothetical protein